MTVMPFVRHSPAASRALMRPSGWKMTGWWLTMQLSPRCRAVSTACGVTSSVTSTPLTAASGVKPEFIGKPNRNMVDIISGKTGVPNENICCVGDRLYTDIAVAQNAGAVSVCVLSGESSMDDINAAERKPDYVLKNVAELAQILKAN